MRSETVSDTPKQDIEAVEEDHQDRFARRDAETLMALGFFMSVIAVPVLIGTVWSDRLIAQVVNATAGIVLLAIGVGMFLFGLSQFKKLKGAGPADQ
jgi:hypothetical protein